MTVYNSREEALRALHIDTLSKEQAKAILAVAVNYRFGENGPKIVPLADNHASGGIVYDQLYTALGDAGDAVKAHYEHYLKTPIRYVDEKFAPSGYRSNRSKSEDWEGEEEVGFLDILNATFGVDKLFISGGQNYRGGIKVDFDASKMRQIAMGISPAVGRAKEA